MREELLQKLHQLFFLIWQARDPQAAAARFRAGEA